MDFFHDSPQAVLPSQISRTDISLWWEISHILFMPGFVLSVWALICCSHIHDSPAILICISPLGRPGKCSAIEWLESLSILYKDNNEISLYWNLCQFTWEGKIQEELCRNVEQRRDIFFLEKHPSGAVLCCVVVCQLEHVCVWWINSVVWYF